ncbi:Retrotransposon, unclassified-like protein [Sesbania bispinosa]|nr:Retrotransposon, unclassified-like protein [Sesbania bispinosa]
MGGRGSKELNLLSSMETITPTQIDMHAMIPVDVLNSIMASQQSLANLVVDLKSQAKEGENHRPQNHSEISPKCHDDTLVTQGELRRLLQAGKEVSITSSFDLEPPLVEEVLAIPYPVGYQPPSFKKFDGTASVELITTFAELMRKGAYVVEAIKRQGKRPKDAEGAYDIYALEERGRKKNFRSNPPNRRFTPQANEDLPHLPINRQQACQLAEEWLKDGTIQPRVNKPPLTNEQYDDPAYCMVHRTTAHTTLECFTIGHAFQRQVRAGKVLLPEKEKEEDDLHMRPLPDHGVNAITTSNNRIRVEEVDEEGNTEEEALALGLAKKRSFRILFGLLGLDQDAQYEAAKALMRVIKDNGGELSTANAPLTKLARSHATSIIFREPAL